MVKKVECYSLLLTVQLLLDSAALKLNLNSMEECRITEGVVCMQITPRDDLIEPNVIYF